MGRDDLTHTVDGAEIVPGMRVLDYDRKWGIVDPGRSPAAATSTRAASTSRAGTKSSATTARPRG